MDESGNRRGPAGDDLTIEVAVLQQLLALHPVQLSFEELVREISGGPTDFAATDPVDRAVGQLCAAGLARRDGDVVRPTRAALRYFELLD